MQQALEQQPSARQPWPQRDAAQAPSASEPVAVTHRHRCMKVDLRSSYADCCGFYGGRRIVHA